jgi:hypothetical protein
MARDASPNGVTIGKASKRNMMLNKSVKEVGVALLKAVHRAGLKLGLVILPNHYYTPIADIDELKRSQDVWARRSGLVGVKSDIGEQARQLREMVAPYEAEFRGNKAYLEGMVNGFGPGFGYVEAQCLHGVLRSIKPKRIIEVGSGVSTHCTLNAIALNAKEGAPAQLTCIEPYPRQFLLDSSEVRLIARRVQELDPSEFNGLERGDVLFIDSTHAIKPGGDVLYLYLEVLPRLKPGVIVHIHDIYFPYLYQRDVLDGLFQWSETALLQALLVNNSRLSILFSLSMLHYDAPDALKQVFPEYVRAPDESGLARFVEGSHFPSSTYLVTN